MLRLNIGSSFNSLELLHEEAKKLDKHNILQLILLRCVYKIKSLQ